jgi:outer membrane protein assembly factor BamB
VGKLVAYDPATGKELWHCEGIGAGGKGLPPVEPKNLPPGVPKNFPPVEPYTVTTPVARDGIVYLVGGGGPTRAIAMAVKAGGRGDVNSTHVLWRKNIAEALGSPSVIGNSLCWVNGVLTALDVKDGSPRAKERLCGNSVDYTSPVTVGTKLYALTRLDGLFVVDENNEFQTVAHLNFPEEKGVFNSTPAVSDGRLYARSNEFLYCVGKKTPE